MRSILNLDSPPGFQGLDFESPIECYTRKLPHWRQVGATYFVTFRLADSLPQHKLQELASLRARFKETLECKPTKAAPDQLTREMITRIEKWLDQGLGECQLRDPQLSDLVKGALHFFDGNRYQLGCYVIMPNHVHAIVKPLAPQERPLEVIVQSWKRHTARKINQIIGVTGAFWQPESFDRIIRDDEHLYKTIQYIGNNPKLAGLRCNEYKLWIRPEWTTSGWNFRQL